MKYKKYPTYKDSGIEWLGEIPEEWETFKIKHLFNLGRGRVIAIEELENNGSYPVYSSQTKNNGILGFIKTYDFNCKQITWTTDGANAGTVFLREGKHNCTNVCGTLQSINKNENLEYIIYSLQYSTPFYKRPDTNGAKIMNGEMAEIFLTYPPIKEQQQIADFLDNATAKIDKLIEKQTKLCELLKEKRQAVISKAVTKGINPNVKMKDSGIEWLGEIPEHWIEKQFRYATKIYRGKFGHRPRNDPSLYDGIYPFIQTGDIARANKYITKYKQTINDLGIKISEKFPKNTLVMAIAANVGDVAILNFEAYAPDSIVGFLPKKDIDLMYLRYSFIGVIDILKSTAIQSTQANLNIDRISSVKFLFPPLLEQRQIADYLDDKTSKIDTLIEKVNKSIVLLKEKRTALISATVTGKIDVRSKFEMYL